MKKLIALAAAATCGAALAVESANIVGYQNIGFDSSGYIVNIGVQFSNIASADGKFTLNDSFFGGAATEGDQIVMFDANAWNLATYDKQGAGSGWLLMPADGGDPEVVASVIAGKGDVMYVIPAVATEITVAGEVAPSGEQSVTFDLANPDGQYLFPLVNPFPIDTTWGDLNAFTTEGDQLIMFDGTSWNIAVYDRQADGNGWLLNPADGSAPEIVNAPDAVIIPAGGSAYYIPAATTTWTVTL